MKRRVSTVSALLASATAIAALTGARLPALPAPGPGPGPTPIGGHPMFTVQSWGTAKLPATAATTIPTWTGSFTYNATTYSYQMAGTNPAAGSKTTTVPTEILPLKIVMADGVILSASSLAASLKASPVLSKAAFTSGTTQLADAMQRASFWTTVSAKAPKYHLLLGTPTVLPAVTISVPAADGTGYTYQGIPYANINYNWWSSRLQGIITAHAFAATTLPLIVSGSTFLFVNNNPNDCCVYGYHGWYSSASGSNTYAFANWIAAGLVSNGNQDVYTMSHEISEWAADPFVNNTVPTWDQPNGSLCYSNLLEVGDPVEALATPWYTISIGTKAFHPSDIAGVSWFSHASPSSEQNGLYSYKGYLTAPSTLC
jgi:hypothetical protein